MQKHTFTVILEDGAGQRETVLAPVYEKPAGENQRGSTFSVPVVGKPRLSIFHALADQLDSYVGLGFTVVSVTCPGL